MSSKGKKHDAPKNACTMWEWRWTYGGEKHDVAPLSVEKIKAFMQETCDDWAFQVELGKGTEEKEGLLHYQGHMRLTTKDRTPWTTYMESEFKPHYWQPTCTEKINLMKHGIGKHYATKEATRVSGPFSKDLEPEELPPLYDCWDIGDKLTPLQDRIIKELEKQDCREIMHVWGNLGCIGKTTIKQYLRSTQKNMIIIPASLPEPRDMLRWVWAKSKEGQENRATVILDLPRYTDKQRWRNYCLAMEDIKAGDVYDERYTTKDKHIYPPKMVIFSNSAMPEDGLSPDRLFEIKVDNLIAKGECEQFVKRGKRTLESLYS